jgi:hypothetical protein
MSESSESARQAAIIDRLRADAESLAEQGARLTQFGPEPDSDKVHIYLARYSDEARQLLEDRYGDDIIVKSESRMWGGSPSPSGRAVILGTGQTGGRRDSWPT